MLYLPRTKRPIRMIYVRLVYIVILGVSDELASWLVWFQSLFVILSERWILSWVASNDICFFSVNQTRSFRSVCYQRSCFDDRIDEREPKACRCFVHRWIMISKYVIVSCESNGERKASVVIRYSVGPIHSRLVILTVSIQANRKQKKRRLS